MANFTFRLKTLLRVRLQQRDEYRVQLAAAIEEDAILARRQAELDQRRGEAVARRRATVGPGPLDVDRLAELRRYDESLAAEQQQVEEHRRERARQVDERRAALLAADREARVLEKLEARQQQQHDDHQKRREIKTLDEMAAIRRNG